MDFGKGYFLASAGGCTGCATAVCLLLFLFAFFLFLLFGGIFSINIRAGFTFVVKCSCLGIDVRVRAFQV